MPKLSTFPIILRELFSTDYFIREPEPDLIMDEQEQVEAFAQAGKVGALTGVYAYHVEKATPTLQGAKTVIDLGCGSGTFLIKMARLNPDIHFIGLDLSEPMLEKTEEAIRLRALKNVELRLGDFTDLSAFADKSVDGIMSLQALHHLPKYENLEKLYTEIGRVLAPEGAVYLQDLIRLKSKISALHFAYYDEETPHITKLDGERSMRAAFLYSELQELAERYLPETVQSYKTAGVGLYFVQKTPDREVNPETQKRLQSLLGNMTKDTRKVYNDLRLFHRLGGLK
ncbi:MAG: class I SAM-dependent methyltransferase [Bdellovibrionaceae bacterium]|nr:class I SAM-dependent methyltransferase [Pseudobdellovibrionaceae bacterium]